MLIICWLMQVKVRSIHWCSLAQVIESARTAMDHLDSNEIDDPPIDQTKH